MLDGGPCRLAGASAIALARSARFGRAKDTGLAMTALSRRIGGILAALPLAPGLRVLEVGCGPGALAHAIAARVGTGHVLGIDRSPRAIAQAVAGSAEAMASGCLSFRHDSAEDFELAPGETPFDLIVAVRVGALDGRHPAAGARAWLSLNAALAPAGRVFVDGVEVLRGPGASDEGAMPPP